MQYIYTLQLLGPGAYVCRLAAPNRSAPGSWSRGRAAHRLAPRGRLQPSISSRLWSQSLREALLARARCEGSKRSLDTTTRGENWPKSLKIIEQHCFSACQALKMKISCLAIKMASATERKIALPLMRYRLKQRRSR